MIVHSLYYGAANIEPEANTVVLLAVVTPQDGAGPVRTEAQESCAIVVVVSISGNYCPGSPPAQVGSHQFKRVVQF